MAALRADIIQPPSETLPSAADGNKYRAAQLDDKQGVRDLGMLSPKWDGSIKPLPREFVVQEAEWF